MNLTPLEPWIARKIGRPGLERTELEAYQLRCLQATLRLARGQSSFYRRRLAGAPAELTCLAGLEQLPFTTAADLRANPLQFLCVSQDAIRRVVTLDTSGTSGAPKRVYFTRADQELTLDFFHVGMSTFTAPGDRVLILLPGERPDSVGDMLAAALRDDTGPQREAPAVGRPWAKSRGGQAQPGRGALAVPHGPVRDVAETLDSAARAGANVVVGLPTQVLALARAASPGGPAGVWRPASVLLTTDHVPEAIRCAVEQAWGCDVYNHYGMTEMGQGGGVDCAARRGYHLREADLYFEIVDPGSGAPVPDGAEGELVFTTLTRAGMPLIRYRTGDLARWLPGRCACGTCLKTLAHIKTRLDGRVALGGAALTMAELDEALFPLDGLVDFAASVRLAGAQPELSLQVQDSGTPPLTLADEVEAALRALPALRSGAVTLRVRVSREPLSTAGAAKRCIKVI